MLGWFADAPDPDAGLLAFRQVSDALGTTPWYLRLLRDEGAVAAAAGPACWRTSRYAADLLMRRAGGGGAAARRRRTCVPRDAASRSESEMTAAARPAATTAAAAARRVRAVAAARAVPGVAERPAGLARRRRGRPRR